MRTSVGAVPFRRHHIHFIVVESLEKRIIVIEQYNFGLHTVILKECLKRVRHGAV